VDPSPGDRQLAQVAANVGPADSIDAQHFDSRAIAANDLDV
jgi:hypothetical protein